MCEIDLWAHMLSLYLVLFTKSGMTEMFLNTLTNAMKEAFNQSGGFRGPTYSVQNNGRAGTGATNVLPGNGGQVFGSSSAQQGAGNGQHSVQQPVMDYSVGQLAAKIAPASRRLIRDFAAPPYQGRVAPGEIPPGYHYVTKGYALNAYENPGY